MNWFKTGKGVYQGCMLSPCWFNLHAEYVTQNAELDEAQAGIMIARRNLTNLRYADDTTLMAESKEELKNLLMKVKEESEKAGLKLSIQKTKIMASSPITSRQTEQEKVETVADFIFLAPKSLQTVTAAMKLRDTCSLEQKLWHLGRKALTHLDSVLKSRRHHFGDKGPYSQSYGFSSSHIQMWQLDHNEGWVPKNWCFPTVVLEKTLKSSLDNRIKLVCHKVNQRWIFTGRTDAEAPMFWPPDVKS